MKRILILFSLALMVAGCQLPEGTIQHESHIISPVPVIQTVELEGHKYVLAWSSEGVSITHSASCPCHSKTLTEWQQLQLAIALTESRCNPSATGKTQDAGILQLTPIYVREANRVAGTDYAHGDAYDPLKSLYMFEAVQGRHNPERDADKAIELHNPGGASIGYPQKVKQNLELIKRIEAVRSALKEYEYRKSNENYPGGAEAVVPGDGD